MLWRTLKHVEHGFYIDVGANDPTIESVTKAFYDRGWSGINIEPLTSHHADLAAARPRDTNIRCAVGEASGETDIWECDVRGWTTASAIVVSQHQSEGHQGTLHKVPVSTLAEICEKYVQDDIHFLKIDVEGFEKQVVSGMDLSRFRPWVIVIEATKPNTTEEAYEDWEPMVLSGGYLFAYADGLNRFYVSNMHVELLASLKYPPNVFDHFIRAEHLQSELKAQQAEARATQTESRINDLLNSTSWRITFPLRWAARKLRKLKRGSGG